MYVCMATCFPEGIPSLFIPRFFLSMHISYANSPPEMTGSLFYAFKWPRWLQLGILNSPPLLSLYVDRDCFGFWNRLLLHQVRRARGEFETAVLHKCLAYFVASYAITTTNWGVLLFDILLVLLYKPMGNYYICFLTPSKMFPFSFFSFCVTYTLKSKQDKKKEEHKVIWAPLITNRKLEALSPG